MSASITVTGTEADAADYLGGGSGTNPARA
jgi:hypothetical protein